MEYRKFGKLDWDVSVLGFGAMRMPKAPDGGVDEEAAVAMIRYAVDHGVNYIDTAYVYHDGKSEGIVGKALSGAYRGKARIATKCPVWQVKSPEDFDRILDEQLERLGTDHIDFYLLHALNAERWDNVLKLGLLERAEAARASGKIRHFGFSFHDTHDSFVKILEGYEGWDFCQIQYNYMDTENQAGRAGLKLAAEKGIAVVVMEPILGGRLANPPDAVKEVLNARDAKRSPVEWALDWLWDQKEVAVVLSGMSTMDQLRENLDSAREARAGKLVAADQEAIAEAKSRFLARIPIPCTRCGYCMPCPSGVNIPWAFELYNNGRIYDDVKGSRFAYATFMPEAERAHNCVACGACEPKCPQGIRISEWMPRVHGVLGEGKEY